MNTNVAFGDRVRRLRLARDLGQAEFANSVGLSGNGQVSKIEKGRVTVDAGLAAAMAYELGCTVEYLRRPSAPLLSTRPWLRAYADAPAKTVDSVTADNVTALEAVRNLKLKVLPDVTPFFDGDLQDDDAIEEFAGEVRAAASIDEGAVVGNVMRAAERLGCVVLPMDSELGRHLGLSQRIDETPVIRVSRPSDDPSMTVPGDRQRFTVAHEMGHVTLHSQCPPPEDAREAQLIEKQAHRFAAAFLAPGDALVEDWQSLGGRTTLTTLSHLKANWGIAIKALVVRLQHLSVVDAEQARSLYKQISARDWNKNEPVPVSNESAIWLSRAVEKKIGGQASLSVAAQLEGLSVEYFKRWTDWTPRHSGRGADILPLSGVRRRPMDESIRGSAEVTHFRAKRGV